MTGRKVPLKMDQLLFSWDDDSPDNVYYLDTVSGDVRLVNRNLTDLSDLTDEIETDRDRYLYLPKAEPGQRKTDLRDFLETVEDDDRKKILEMAFESPHVYSSFKSILSKWEGEEERLEEFLTSRTRLRVVQWLEANCIETGPLETTD